VKIARCFYFTAPTSPESELFVKDVKSPVSRSKRYGSVVVW